VEDYMAVEVNLDNEVVAAQFVSFGQETHGNFQQQILEIINLSNKLRI
jgi:hypothetical protein